MKRTAWALVITEGVVTLYPPELYLRLQRAVLEAERWAWILSGNGLMEVSRLSHDRWEVDERDVRLVEVAMEVGELEPWVGTFWTKDGYPDPEAAVFRSREEAREWAVAPIGELTPALVDESAWFIAATFLERYSESYAVAHLAKVVS